MTQATALTAATLRLTSTLFLCVSLLKNSDYVSIRTKSMKGFSIEEPPVKNKYANFLKCTKKKRLIKVLYNVVKRRLFNSLINGLGGTYIVCR
jgi:hypothetical protein